MTDRDRRLRAVPDGAADPGRDPDGAVTVVVRREPGYVLVTASGEIDIAVVPALRACLWPPLAAGEPVVADLGRVGFIDAAGLGVLAAAAGRAAAHGTSLHVACARPQTRRLLRLTGIDRAVRLAGTVAEAAVAAAGAPGAPGHGGRRVSPGGRGAGARTGHRIEPARNAGPAQGVV